MSQNPDLYLKYSSLFGLLNGFHASRHLIGCLIRALGIKVPGTSPVGQCFARDIYMTLVMTLVLDGPSANPYPLEQKVDI